MSSAGGILYKILLITLIFLTGNNNFVMTTDPNHLENILRAEGKYPMRDNNSLPNMEWIIKDLKYPVMFGTQ